MGIMAGQDEAGKQDPGDAAESGLQLQQQHCTDTGSYGALIVGLLRDDDQCVNHLTYVDYWTKGLDLICTYMHG